MLKLGLIGTGGICHAHADGYKRLSDRVEFTACCDIDIDKARRFAEEYDIPRYYGSCEEMLAAEKLDICSVTTWNSAHAECTIAALNAGCHVICEKPMAMNADEARAMKAAADKNGKLLMLGFVRRHGRDAKAALDFYNKGFLGDVYYAKATYLRRNGFPGGWFGDKSRSGGGPLIDLGVHVIDLTRYVMGNPKAVSVYGATFDKLGARSELSNGEWNASTKEAPIFTVEDLAVAMIRFENGCVLNVETSFNLNMKARSNAIELFGDKAGISLDPFELYTVVDNHIADISLPDSPDFNFSRDFMVEIRNFVDSVEGKATCIAPAEDGVELMKILDGIYESARIGKAVEL